MELVDMNHLLSTNYDCILSYINHQKNHQKNHIVFSVQAAEAFPFDQQKLKVILASEKLMADELVPPGRSTGV